MTEIRETKLPGVGVLHDFDAECGDRIGVISHHGDRCDVVIFDREDPDRVRATVSMNGREARDLADLLGGSTISERLDKLRSDIDGLAIDWLPISPTSPYVGRTIGETELRSRTGVSIVAVVRSDQPLPAPGPDGRLAPNDTAVVVGTAEGIDAAARLLAAPAA